MMDEMLAKMRDLLDTVERYDTGGAPEEKAVATILLLECRLPWVLQNVHEADDQVLRERADALIAERRAALKSLRMPSLRRH